MLFKILKGDSSRVSTDITPFHEGWAYFAPDTGEFYIDAVVDGEQRRVKVKGDSGSAVGGREILITLAANGWTDNKKTISIDGLTKFQTGIISVAQSATVEEENAAANARLKIFSQEDGSLTIHAVNGAPTCNIPISIILFEKHVAYPDSSFFDTGVKQVIASSHYPHYAKEYKLLNDAGKAVDIYRTADDIRAAQVADGSNATKYGAIEPELLRYYYVYKSNEGMLVNLRGYLIDENGTIIKNTNNASVFASSTHMDESGNIVANNDNNVLISKDLITPVTRKVYSAALSNDGTSSAECRQSFYVEVTANSPTSRVVIYSNVPQAFNPGTGVGNQRQETYEGTGRAISQGSYGYTLGAWPENGVMGKGHVTTLIYPSTGDNTNRKYPSFEAVATEYVYFDIVAKSGDRERYVLEMRNADSDNHNLIQIPQSDGSGYDFGIWAFAPGLYSDVRGVTPNAYPLYRTTGNQAASPTTASGSILEYNKLEYIIQRDTEADKLIPSLGGWKYVKALSDLTAEDVATFAEANFEGYALRGASTTRLGEVLASLNIGADISSAFVAAMTAAGGNHGTLYEPYNYITKDDGTPVLDFKGEYLPTLFGVDLTTEVDEADLWVQCEYNEAAVGVNTGSGSTTYYRASENNGENDPVFVHLNSIPGVGSVGDRSIAIYVRSENQQWTSTNAPEIQGQLYELRFNRV